MNIKAMELMLIPLFILIAVGVLYNNFSSAATMSTVLVEDPVTGTWSYYNQTSGTGNYNGCNPTLCSLNSPSFLNPNSPFTLLLQGNVIGFFSNVFTSSETQNIIYSGYTLCIPQLNGVYANDTGAGIHKFQCLGYVSYGSGQLPSVLSPLNATSNDGNNSVWTIEGCSSTSTCHLSYGNGIESFNGTWNFMSFYGFYVLNGTVITGSSGCTIYGSVQTCQVLMPWLFHTSTTFTCPSTPRINGLNINATYYYCLIPVNNPSTPTTTNTTSALPNSFAGISFLFGIILLFLGLGLALTSAVVGFSINEQGTRLAQIAGIGLVVWSFCYDEFSGWTALLGLGLGTITITILTIMFFFGIFWQSQSFL